MSVLRVPDHMLRLSQKVSDRIVRIIVWILTILTFWTWFSVCRQDNWHDSFGCLPSRLLGEPPRLVDTPLNASVSVNVSVSVNGSVGNRRRISDLIFTVRSIHLIFDIDRREKVIL